MPVRFSTDIINVIRFILEALSDDEDKDGYDDYDDDDEKYDKYSNYKNSLLELKACLHITDQLGVYLTLRSIYGKHTYTAYGTGLEVKF